MDVYLRRRAHRLVERIAPHLPVGGRVLDVGSGTGHNAAVLRARGFDVVATDVADLHTVGPPPVRCEDGRLPFADAAFDAAIVLYVVQYADDAAALLREVARVAARAVVLQSTYRGALGRSYLSARELVTGRGALRVARVAGLVGEVASPLDRPRLVTRSALLAAVRRAGLAARPGAPLSPLPVSRDLLVVEAAR